METPVYFFNGMDNGYFDHDSCLDTFHRVLSPKRSVYIHSEPGCQH